MKSLIMLSIFSSMVWFSASAQILKPAKWSYAAKKTSATEATIYIKATIDEGWHIYALDNPPEGPVSTAIKLSPDKSYQVTGAVTQPAPLKKTEQLFAMEVKYFEKTVIFQQKVKLLANSPTVKGAITFMVCSDQQCLPPETIDFSVAIK